jgi:hypothetical protein
MEKRRKLLIIAGGVAVCLAVGRLAVSLGERPGGHGGSGGNRYEIEPVVTLPDYGGEAGRTIDAYERLMERYMDLAESRIAESNEGRQKLDSIDAKIGDISARLARIEKAMGIDANGTEGKDKVKRKK